jgi:hypothetical protein
VPQAIVAFLGPLLDELIDRFGGGDHADEVAAARKEYDDRRGRVFEDEELWEPWTQAFLEWYVIERVLPPGDYPPAAALLAEEPEPRRAAALRALLSSHRSLFEVLSLRAGRVELCDLLGGAQFSVAEPRAMHGVGVGDVAEARLIGFEGEVVFGRTFCFHPTGTSEAIAGHARRMLSAGSDRRDVIDLCARLRVRAGQYRHVPARRLYEATAADLSHEERAVGTGR